MRGLLLVPHTTVPHASPHPSALHLHRVVSMRNAPLGGWMRGSAGVCSLLPTLRMPRSKRVATFSTISPPPPPHDQQLQHQQQLASVSKRALVRSHPIDESDLERRARFNSSELALRSSLVSREAKSATEPWRQFMADHPRVAWIDDHALFLPNGFIGAVKRHMYSPLLPFPGQRASCDGTALPLDIDAWFRRSVDRHRPGQLCTLATLPAGEATPDVTTTTSTATCQQVSSCSSVPPRNLHADALLSDTSPPLRRRPIHLELGSGSGEWIVDKCNQRPDVDFVAVELNAGRMLHILGNYLTSSSASSPLLVPHNLRIIRGEVHFLFEQYLRDAQFDAVYVNFPDSWPKKHQFHRRLIQPHFVAQLHRKLRPHARVHLVTDHHGLMQWMRDAFLARPDHFTPSRGGVAVDQVDDARRTSAAAAAAPAAAAGVPADYGLSMYGRLWAARGFAIHYLEFVSVPTADSALSSQPSR